MIHHAVGFPNSPKVIHNEQTELHGEQFSDNSTSLPPSYDSIFGQFKENHAESSSLHYFKKALIMFGGAAGCTLSMMLLLLLPMSMLVIGTLYRDECPKEPLIPVYLIVGGAFGIIKTVVIILQRVLYGDDSFMKGNFSDQTDEVPLVWVIFDSVLNIFLFVWFLIGNFWVYSIFKPHFVAPVNEPMNFCNETVYMYSFWVITVSYIIIGLICLCTCCLGVCASCTAYFVTSGNQQTEK